MGCDSNDMDRRLEKIPTVTAPEPWPAPPPKKAEAVNHPDHYGGGDNPYEVIKVIRAWKLGFNLGNTVKYIARAGKKNLGGLVIAAKIEDLEKAAWYLNDEIAALKKEMHDENC